MATSESIVRRGLLSAVLESPAPLGHVEVVRIELAPGQAAGLHMHPCPVVGVVVSGTICFQVEGERERTLHSGDAFLEPRNATITHFDNASKEEPAAFIACYLLAPGESQLIEMLE